MQSSPGTGTGESEARSGLSQWNVPGMSRRRRTSARSSASRSGSQRHRERGDRSARHRDRDDRRPRQRASTRSETPRAIQDRPERTGVEGHGKRRVSDASDDRSHDRSHEGIIEQLQHANEELTEGMQVMNCLNEELTERVQVMSRQITQLEEVAASRERLSSDIEIKFTNYLRGYNENVTNEIQELNRRVSSSTNELAEYQIELMIAAKEDEGSEMHSRTRTKRKPDGK